MSIQKDGGIILDSGCDLNCVFCGGNPKPENLKLKEQEIRVYNNLQDYKKEGIKSIVISGSDPAEYDKIIDLARYMKEEGFEFINLSTNGTKLSDLSFARELVAAGIDSFRIPLYGSNITIHDKVTKKDGSFYQTLTGIKNLLNKVGGVKIQISCLIVNENKTNLFEIIDLVNLLGVKNFYFSIPCLVSMADQSFYIPIKDIVPYIKEIYPYAIKINNQTLFREIPFCVFGVFNQKNINNTCKPLNLGKHNQPQEKYKTSIPNMPSYRIKKKIRMCGKCKAFDHCDGFFVNDIDKFGVGELKPIK